MIPWVQVLKCTLRPDRVQFVQHLVQPSFWPYYIPISNKVRSPAWKTPRQEGQRGNDYPIEHALNADRARVQRHRGAYRPRYYTYTKPPWPAKLLSALISKPLTRAAYFRVPPPWLNPASCILIKVPRGLWGLAHTQATEPIARAVKVDPILRFIRRNNWTYRRGICCIVR